MEQILQGQNNPEHRMSIFSSLKDEAFLVNSKVFHFSFTISNKEGRIKKKIIRWFCKRQCVAFCLHHYLGLTNVYERTKLSQVDDMPFKNAHVQL